MNTWIDTFKYTISKHHIIEGVKVDVEVKFRNHVFAGEAGQMFVVVEAE